MRDPSFLIFSSVTSASGACDPAAGGEGSTVEKETPSTVFEMAYAETLTPDPIKVRRTTRCQDQGSIPLKQLYLTCFKAAHSFFFNVMVLVTEKSFQLVKRSCLVSFLLYAGTQLRVQTENHKPGGEPYYPHPVAFFSFFIVQALLQACWLRKLFFSKPIPQCYPVLLCPGDEETALDPAELPPQEVVVDSVQMAYVPFYIAANIFLACASELWMYRRFAGSQVLSVCGMASQLYAVFILLSTSGRYSMSRKNLLTHIVAKSAAGLGILYVWKGWGVIDNSPTPPTSELIQSTVICLLLTVASGPDPTLGLCIIFDLIALFYGPGSSDIWRRTFVCNIGIIAITIATDILTAKIKGIRIIRDDTSRPPPDHTSLDEKEDV